MNLKTILVIAIFVGLAYMAGSCQGGKSWMNRYEEYRDNAIVITTELQRKSDSLEAGWLAQKLQYERDTTTLRNEIREYRTMAERLRGSNQRLADSLKKLMVDVDIDTLPPVCQLCFQLNDSLTTENKSLVSQNTALVKLDTANVKALTSLSGLYDSEKYRADSLSRIIFNLPKPQYPKLFGLFRISPTTAFMAGVVVTSAGVITLDRLLEKKDE